MLNRDEVLKLLAENMDRLEEFGVKKIGIFGSFARDEAEMKSDVDVVVEFKRGRGGLRDFIGLVDFLEGLLKREVEILTPAGIETIRIKSVRERIKREVLYV